MVTLPRKCVEVKVLTNMTEKLSWIKVLNDEADWKGEDQLLNWLSAQCGIKLNPSKKALAGFEEVLKQMRNAIDSLHFGEDLMLDWIDERLGATSFSLSYADWMPVTLREFLPLLHAKVKDDSHDALIQALSDTLILQFSQFVNSTFSGGEESGIARCQGVFRLPGNPKVSPVTSQSPENEMRWRKEIDLLDKHDLMEAPELQRCPDLFVASPKARFCSDACRFGTFQIAKHLSNPDYHAEKQKRYRKKQAGPKKG